MFNDDIYFVAIKKELANKVIYFQTKFIQDRATFI